jgi:rhamnosyltransferase
MSAAPRSIGVAVITHRAVSLLPQCLPPLFRSPLRPKILVVNSSSNDGTVECARGLGADVMEIPRAEFNHGTTRELARRTLGTDVVVMLTPDAKLLGSEMLDHLVQPILRGEASVSYARQVPHACADFFEAFPREFNYPDKSEFRSIDDGKRLGPAAFFCSNACAAWSYAALDAIGGFVPTLSLEDTIATARLLRAGHRIAYCANAVVAHSHRYSLAQEFRRHFDTGYVRAQQKFLLLADGCDERRGAAYSTGLLRRLLSRRPWLIPYGIAHLASKYFGYRVGFHGHRLPVWLKRCLSAQDYYWQHYAAPAELPVSDAEPRAAT